MQKEEKCLVCSTKLLFYGNSEGKKILVCPNCGLGQTEDFVLPSLDYHRDEVYIYRALQFTNIFMRRVNLIEKFATRGKILEIGSSNGLLLSLLKSSGWEVQGIEPSKTSAEFAQKKGIPTLQVTFEDAILTGKFDVVILNHVLEHLTDPRATMQKIKQLLKKGGMVFIDVPNFSSLAAKIGGGSWKYILPHEHKWHFTPQSLSRLLEKVGFRVVYQETTSGVWDYADPLADIWQSLITLKRRFFSNILTLVPSWFIGKLGLGTGLIIIVRKR